MKFALYGLETSSSGTRYFHRETLRHSRVWAKSLSLLKNFILPRLNIYELDTRFNALPGYIYAYIHALNDLNVKEITKNQTPIKEITREAPAFK